MKALLTRNEFNDTLQVCVAGPKTNVWHYAVKFGSKHYRPLCRTVPFPDQCEAQFWATSAGCKKCEALIKKK